MNLSVVHLGLLAGVAFAAIPVIIHMVMRQKPKHVIFPALRLLKARQKQTTRRLRIRQWALLASRMAVICLMALCLARPTCNTTATLGESNVPAAIGLVVDTSLSMQWTDARNRDRLTEAKELALKVVRETPITSQVFLIDSAEPIETPAMSPATAESRIKKLALKPDNQPLNSAIEAAYQSVRKSDRPRKEIYVLTDLTEHSFSTANPVQIAMDMEIEKSKQTQIQLYVLRLNPPDPQNVGLKNLRLDNSAAVTGEPLDIRFEMTNQGPATTRVIELWLDGRKREQKAFDLSANSNQEVIMRTPPLDDSQDGLHQGEIRIRDEDPMLFDNTLFFSAKVKPTVKVLIVTDLEQDALFLSEALDPTRGAQAGAVGISRPFRVEILRTSQLSDRLRDPQKRPQVVILNNVATISEPLWTQLNLSVRSGMGLALAFGDRCKPDSYSSQNARQLLPGDPMEVVNGKPSEPWSLMNPDRSHPIFSQYFEELRTELSTIPVFRYEKIAKAESGVRSLLEISDGSLALAEKVFDQSVSGKVLLWSTPLSRRPSSNDPAAWNDLPRSWAFVQLVNRMASYLSNASETGFIVEAGRDLSIELTPNQGINSALIKGPGDRPGERRVIEPGESRLVLTSLDTLGHWGVGFSGNENVASNEGFSVNAPSEESQTRTLTSEQIDQVLGKESYALAQDTDSLEKAVGLARVGVEFFPYLMLLLLLVLTLENYIANRFYRDQPSTVPPTARQGAGT